MGFLKNLAGGLVIMVIATLVGVLHNSVRSKPVALFLEVPSNVARKAPLPKATSSESAAPATSAAEQTPEEERGRGITRGGGAQAGLAAGPITAEEYAGGELGKERLKALVEAGTIILLDARSEHEFAEGHLPGAINIPYDNFVDYYNDLVDLVPLDADVVTYCRSVTCDLSDNLATELQLAGYEKVLVYRGGWLEWTEANFPTEAAE